jgi:hypothetical protein
MKDREKCQEMTGNERQVFPEGKGGYRRRRLDHEGLLLERNRHEKHYPAV